MPPPQLRLRDDKILKILKHLYGLPYAGDYWNRTISVHFNEDLDLSPSLRGIFCSPQVILIVYKE